MATGSVISQPEVTFSLASANSPVQNAAQKVLVVGQKTVVGDATDGQWFQNFPNDGSENQRFGENSQLSAMIRAAKSVSDRVQLDVIALDDAAGTPRQVTIGVTGTATEAGTLTLTVGSAISHRYLVAVADAEAAATTLANLATAVNADDRCPFTATVNAGDLELDAVNDGTVANDLGIEVSGSVAGIVVGTVTDATPGATDPTVTTTLDVVGNTRYQGIVWPYSGTTELTVLKAFLDARFNVTNGVQDGVAFVGAVDTHTNLLSDLNTNHNSQSLVMICDEAIADGANGYIGPAVNEPSYVKAALVAQIRALRLTPDQAISRYLTSSASRDQFGGPALASLPYFNTPLPQLSLPESGRGFTSTEIEQLKDAGGSVLGQNIAGSAAIAGEVVTTYLTDPAGNPDVTWTFLNYVDTASQAREYMWSNVRKRFAQSRLTQGSVIAGRDMANALTIKTYLVQLYRNLAGENFTLVQDGQDAVNYFKQNINISIDMALGKATITMLLPIVTQLRTIIATVKIDFDITA